MGKEYYKYIFVILTFRNYQDLGELLSSINEKISDSFKCIIVNSHYDDETEQIFRTIASVNDCVFIDVENKGYGSGNNRGIEYALVQYEFDLLFVSNPDTLIDHFPENLDVQRNDIIAPLIKTLDGNMQNPMLPKKNRISTWLIYQGFAKKLKVLIFAGVAINKIQRYLFLRGGSKDKKEIYQPHGSFIGFGKDALEILFPVFDEQLFLFAEEGLLAWRANENSLKIYYEPSISITHKQDGSMKFLDGINEIMKESNIYVYKATHRSK